MDAGVCRVLARKFLLVLSDYPFVDRQVEEHHALGKWSQLEFLALNDLKRDEL
jgi:hypothetical protein